MKNVCSENTLSVTDVSIILVLTFIRRHAITCVVSLITFTRKLLCIEFMIFCNIFFCIYFFANVLVLILVDSFLMLSSGIIYGYYAMILKIDEEDFGGHGALLQEGLFASITLFLVLSLS